ncbi:uncharacterized protein JCM10292_001289 [Rhodotorula paludigena]|uniref:uncharacterized protein n=1 Tax=Rhodotorula paludigena TaxID=86838 RepID=UPI00317E2B3F
MSHTGDRPKIKAEPTDAALSRNPPIAPSVQPESKGVRLFKPGEPLVWTASTSIPVILNLVNNREAIFARHRAAFSLEPGIPTYPVTNASIALALFAKYSRLSTNSKTFRQDIVRVKRATDPAWEPSAALNELDDMDADGKALSQFMAEGGRGAAYTRRNRAKKTAERGRKALTVHDVDESPDSDSESDSEPDSDSDSDSENSSTSEDEDKKRRTRASKSRFSLTSPGFPQCGESFNSVQQLYQAVVASIVPANGISAKLARVSDKRGKIRCSRYHTRGGQQERCPWELAIYAENHSQSWKVDSAASSLLHNHDRDPRIVADPNWRPVINNPLARQALGLTNTAIGKRRSSNGLGEQGEGGSSVSAKKAITLLNDALVASTSASLPTGPSAFALNALHRPFPAEPPRRESAGQTLGPPFGAATITQPCHSSASSGTLSVSHLAAFLRSLDTSLEALAKPLHAAGLQTHKALVLFLSFSADVVDRLLAKVSRTKGKDWTAEISLFKKRLNRVPSE